MFTDSNVQVPENLKHLLKDSVSSDPIVAGAATHQLQAAISAGPLKKGVLYGDIVTGIFTMQAFEAGVPIVYPLDIVGASDVRFHVAYTVPFTGYTPQRTVEGDYLAVKTYKIATSIDWSREMAEWSRWDVVGRAMQVAEAGVVRKRNNDGWHTILAAAVDRNISISDTSAANGLFTKRLVALAQTVMRRNAGGNSTSIDKGRLSHIAISPESLQDIRSWDLTQVDDVTRREIFLGSDDMMSLTKIFGVTLIDIDELGVGQEFQKYYNNTLAATTPNSKDEIAIGLDLINGAQDSFLMPWVKRENGQFFQMHEDPVLLRLGRKGFFGEGRMGSVVLDNRRVIILGI
jgi:hypothetical protein